MKGKKKHVDKSPRASGSRSARGSRGKTATQWGSVEHIVLHRHYQPSAFGPHSKHSCTDIRRIRVPKESRLVLSVIITDSSGVPDWGPPWRRFRKSIVQYNTDDPKLRRRVNRLRRRIEAGRCLAGGPLNLDAKGVPRTVGRRISGSLRQQDLQFYLDMSSAFSPTPQFLLVDKGGSPRRNKRSLWERFGRDRSVGAVPLRDERESPFWTEYRQVFRAPEVRERKRRCDRLIRDLRNEKGPNGQDPRFPSLQLKGKKWERLRAVMVMVLLKSAPIPGSRRRRPAFQSCRTLVEALAAAFFGRHARTIRRQIPTHDRP